MKRMRAEVWAVVIVVVAVLGVVGGLPIAIHAVEPSDADKRIVREYLNTHLADKNYEDVQWYLNPEEEGGYRRVYVTVRFTTALGGPAIDTYRISIRNGKITAAYDRAVFPGSPEDEAGKAYQDFIRGIANGSWEMDSKGKPSRSPVGKSGKVAPLSREGEAVKSLETWTPPAKTVFWLTFCDGTRVCGRVSKDGDGYTIATRYGKLSVDRSEILTVRKAIPPEKL